MKDAGAEASIVVAVAVSVKIMAVLLGATTTALGGQTYALWFCFVLLF